MVAVGSGVTAGMPTRPYSAAILGGLWPTTSPDSWSDVGDSLLRKSQDDSDTASAIMRAADSLLDENSGQTIEAMHGKYMGDRLAVVDQADLYQTMSEVVDQVAQLIYHARARLDEIDREANEEIERLKQAAMSHKGAYVAATQAIATVIAKAKAAAAAECAKCAGEIFAQGARIGVKPPEPPAATGTPDPLDDLKGLKGLGGGSIRDGMPTGLPLGNLPQDGSLPQKVDPNNDLGKGEPVNGAGKSDIGGSEPGTTKAAAGQSNQPKGSTAGGNAPDSRILKDLGGGEPSPTAPQGIPPVAAPFGPSSAAGGLKGLSGGGSSGGGIGGLGGGGLSGLGGGGMPGGASGMPAGGGGSIGSLGPSVGNPTAGLTTPASGGVLSTPPANEFARGFGSGLSAAGGPGPMLPPPAAATPPPSSGAPTGSISAGPAPISSTAGPAPSAASMAASASAGAPMAPMMVPPAGGGTGAPLPPFGSDVARQAAVTPAAGGPTAPPAPTAAPAPASAPLAPLPPGVVASGVGASAVGAGLGVRSTAPDPLLESASGLVYQLMHGSRLYAAIDWCVGVFKTPAGIETVVVSNEGCGYIPVGVFVPRSARMLFSDNNLGNGFRSRWFSWVNPAQTMLAYAASCSEGNPNVELWALAVSTDHGGSAVPARDAGIRHFEDCSLMTSPISVGAPAAALDQSHQHRLETIDGPGYARITGAGGRAAMDRAEMWGKTLGAVRTTLSRTSNLLGLAVPPIVRHVTSALGNGEPVTDDQWNDLELARLNATLDSASQRPGRMLDSEGVTPHARAYHNLARATELLGLWRDVEPPGAEIAYVAHQITGEAAIWPTGN